MNTFDSALMSGMRSPGAQSPRFQCQPVRALEADGTPVPEMTVTFLGVAGTGGILPWHYTQSLIDQAREKDFGLRDFLDLFNHRLIANFYRAWKKCHFYVGYELSRRSRAKSPTALPRYCSALQEWARADYGTDRPFPTKCSCITRDISPVARGRPWRWNGSSVRSFTFRFRSSSSRANGCTCGRKIRHSCDEEVTTCSACLQLLVEEPGASRIKSGFALAPLSHDDFQAFLPGGSEFVSLAQIVRSFAGPAFDFDLQLVISKDEVPPCQLNRVRLGWNAWMFSKRPTRNLEDAVFACEGLPSH